MRIPKPSELKSMRMRLGLTQTQLAELSGVTQAYIAKIESGDADPRISTLEKILKALEKASKKTYISAERVMAKPVISVKPTDRVEKAIKLMVTYDISQLPVLKEGVQVGSISEATLMHKIEEGEDMFKLIRRSVGEIMDDPFPAVSKGYPIDTVYSLLTHHPAVMVTDQGKSVGIITKADILKLMGEFKK